MSLRRARPDPGPPRIASSPLALVAFPLLLFPRQEFHTHAEQDARANTAERGLGAGRAFPLDCR